VRRPARLDPRIGTDRLLGCTTHRGECSGAGERRTPSARIAATEGALFMSLNDTTPWGQGGSCQRRMSPAKARKRAYA
jgi:hypothetical protein